MANYYLKYELSMSLNGKKVVHIARNAAGNVVFREPSEEKLKKAIDSFEEERKREEIEAARLQAEKEKAKADRKKKKFFANKLQEEVQERSQAHLPGEAVDEPVQHLEGEAQDTPGEQPTTKKSSFWDKLK